VVDIVRDVAPIDLDEQAEAAVTGHQLMTHEEMRVADGLQRQVLVVQRAGNATQGVMPTLSEGNVGYMRKAREAFEAASDGDAAEDVLEQFVTGEVGIGLQLQDLEAAAASLLGQALVDPTLAMATAKVMRELIAISSAVRRRTEHTLTTIAGLRAQRQLLAAQRGRRGD
jgi:hypothetical protein